MRVQRTQFIDYSGDQRSAQTDLIELLIGLIWPHVRRTKSLSGTWTGILDQHEGPSGQPLRCNVLFKLTTERQNLIGTAIIDNIIPYAGVTELNLKLNGVVSHERFVQLNYNSENPIMIQFGAVLCELSDTGREMSGKIIGYGLLTRRIISGSLELRKEPEEGQ